MKAPALALWGPGGRTILVTLACFGIAAPIAQAAPSPDPAPQHASFASAPGPSPDPSPQAAPVQPAQSAPVMQAPAPVVPQPTSSGIGVVPAAGSGEPSVTSTARVIQPSAPARKVGRHTVHRVQLPAISVSTVAHRLTSPWRRISFLTPASLGARPTAAPARNGLLLLLGSAALAVLAVASASMLRLLRQMDGVRWS